MFRNVGLVLIVGFLLSSCREDAHSCEVFEQIEGDGNRLTLCDSSLKFDFEQIDEFTGESWTESKEFKILEKKNFKKLSTYLISEGDSIYSRFYFIRRKVGDKEMLNFWQNSFDLDKKTTRKSLKELKELVNQEVAIMEKEKYYPVPFNPYLKVLDKEQLKHDFYGDYVYSKKEGLSVTYEKNHFEISYDNYELPNGEIIKLKISKYKILHDFLIEDFSNDRTDIPNYKLNVKALIVSDQNEDYAVVFSRFTEIAGIKVAFFSNVIYTENNCIDKSCVEEWLKTQQVCPYCFDVAPYIIQD